METPNVNPQPELARLIAAAPELLEAMMAIEERYIDGCDTYEDWKFMGDTARAALQFLHNAERIHGDDGAGKPTNTKKR